MHHFRWLRNRLCCEDIPLETLAAKYGTPLFVYSEQTLVDHYQRLNKAFAKLDHLICFALKSNSNLAVLAALARLGSGFDIVSEGELRRVIAAGGDPENCVFAGVGKSESEITFALRKGIYAFNVESEPELVRINRIAGQVGRAASVAVRVNPNVDAHTHTKITTGTYQNKFGIPLEEVERIYARAAKLRNIRLRGLQMHIGSQLTEVAPFQTAVEKVTPLLRHLCQRFPFEFFSIGGGIGIVYEPALASGNGEWWQSPQGRRTITPEQYAEVLIPLLEPLGLKILLEPGRFISGNAGVLLTRVEYVKTAGPKTFVIVDAAMNDLIRPSFYDAYHEIVPVRQRTNRNATPELIPSDVVGPICESGDSFCKDRPLPPVREGDYLALLSAGAYGFVMASNYNSRPMAAEVLVRGRQETLVRKRQPLADLWRLEHVPAWVRTRGAAEHRLPHGRLRSSTGRSKATAHAG